MKCVAIMGATATGKSAAGIALARRFGGEIVSMDSRQVYRGLDVGTGKVTREERRVVPHHLLDVVEPSEAWSAGNHAAAARAVLSDVAANGRAAFLVGGTGLYFRALFDGLVDVSIPKDVSRRIRAALGARDTAELYNELQRRDPRRAAELTPLDRVRIARALELIEFTGRPVGELYAEGAAAPRSYEPLRLVLTMPRAELRERVAERTRALFAAGWVDEVKGLLEAGVSLDAPAMKSLGYGEIAAALGEGSPVEDVVARVITATQQYAKRQETFFRGEGDAVWIDVTAPGWEEEAARRVAAHLGSQ